MGFVRQTRSALGDSGRNFRNRTSKKRFNIVIVALSMRIPDAPQFSDDRIFHNSNC